MNKPIHLVLLFMITAADLAGQTLTIDDMVKNIRSNKDYKSIRVFVEKHGFDYDTLLPGSAGMIYTFVGQKEYQVKGIDDDTLQLKDAVFLKMDDEVTLRKVTLMTASKDYYQQLTREMVAKKFKVEGTPNRNKPMSYVSELFKNVTITIAVGEAVKDDKPYARYQLTTSYEGLPLPKKKPLHHP